MRGFYYGQILYKEYYLIKYNLLKKMEAQKQEKSAFPETKSSDVAKANWEFIIFLVILIVACIIDIKLHY